MTLTGFQPVRVRMLMAKMAVIRMGWKPMPRVT